jgi:hypothetical protein
VERIPARKTAGAIPVQRTNPAKRKDLIPFTMILLVLEKKGKKGDDLRLSDKILAPQGEESFRSFIKDL